VKQTVSLSSAALKGELGPLLTWISTKTSVAWCSAVNKYYSCHALCCQ